MRWGRELSGRGLLVLLGCLACQMGAGLFYASQSLSRDVIEDMGWTRAMWSSALAPMIFISSLSQAFVGAACVRFGVRPVLVLAVVLLGVSFVVLANMSELWHFYVATTCLALGNGGIGDVSIGAVVTRWFRRARSMALGVAMVGSNLGAVVFVHALGVLSDGRTWREATLWVGLLGALCILPFALFAVRDPRPGEGVEGEWAAEDTPDVDVSSTAEAASVSLRDAMRHTSFWVFFFTLFAYALAQLGIANHLILHLTDLGYSGSEARLALEFTVGAGIAAKLGAGVVALRLSARTALFANTALLTTAFALLPFAGNPTVLGLFGVAFGISTAARDVLFPLLVVQVFGTREFAKIFGVFMLAYFPGGGLGPMALGALYDATGSYQLGFGVLGACLAAVLLGLSRVRPETPA